MTDAHIGDSLDHRFSRHFDVREVGDERRALQQFIQDCFLQMHGARIEHFMPRLLSLRTEHGALLAAFGLRSAGSEPLFLESYLDQPIEQVLAKRFGMPVRREEIIEVGNLSAVHAGATRWLIIAVTMLLHREGYKWITFTGTNLVRNGLQRLGLVPYELGAAEIGRLPAAERGQWGNYYSQNPVVMTGQVAHGYQALSAHQGLFKLLGALVGSQPGCETA
jgi:hypothetical protein